MIVIKVSELKPKDNITLIDKYGDIRFFRVSRVGRKYLYGYTCFLDLLTNTVAEVNSWESSYPIDEIVITDKEFNINAKNTEMQIRNAIREYEKERLKVFGEIDREEMSKTREIIRCRQEAWFNRHPKPQDHIKHIRYEILYPKMSVYNNHNDAFEHYKQLREDKIDCVLQDNTVYYK